MLCHMFPNKGLWNLCTARMLFITNLSLFLNFFKSSFLNTQKCLFLLSPLNIKNLRVSYIFLFSNLIIFGIYQSLKKLKSTFICVHRDQKTLSKMQCHYKFSIIKVVKKRWTLFFPSCLLLETLL